MPTKFEFRPKPIDRSIAVFLPEAEPAERSRAFAGMARQEIAKANQQNRGALGANIPYTVAVDGREGAPLDSVKPDGGRIEAKWQLFADAFRWIHDQLVISSPIGPAVNGHYYLEHEFTADGVPADPVRPPLTATVWRFTNTMPYARKLERQYGVYEGVADAAHDRFRRMLDIRFGYVSQVQGTKKSVNEGRTPTIVIRRK